MAVPAVKACLIRADLATGGFVARPGTIHLLRRGSHSQRRAGAAGIPPSPHGRSHQPAGGEIAEVTGNRRDLTRQFITGLGDPRVAVIDAALQPPPDFPSELIFPI